MTDEWGDLDCFEVWEMDNLGEVAVPGVAVAYGSTRAQALSEIRHYAVQYGQDGPVAVYEVRRRLIDPQELFS